MSGRNVMPPMHVFSFLFLAGRCSVRPFLRVISLGHVAVSASVRPLRHVTLSCHAVHAMFLHSFFSEHDVRPVMLVLDVFLWFVARPKP